MIAAVLELAAEGGYDAIQVRAIAERTGISSDTIYRYFGSRDRLIAEAVGQWSDREFYEPAPTWLDGETAAEQLLAYYRRVWAVWEANPRMLETYVRAARLEGDVPGGSPTPASAAWCRSPSTRYGTSSPAYRDDALTAVRHFTHSAMTYVVRGQMSVDDVYPRPRSVSCDGSRSTRPWLTTGPGRGTGSPERRGRAACSVLYITRIMGGCSDQGVRNTGRTPVKPSGRVRAGGCVRPAAEIRWAGAGRRAGCCCWCGSSR